MLLCSISPKNMAKMRTQCQQCGNTTCKEHLITICVECYQKEDDWFTHSRTAWDKTCHLKRSVDKSFTSLLNLELSWCCNIVLQQTGLLFRNFVLPIQLSHHFFFFFSIIPTCIYVNSFTKTRYLFSNLYFFVEKVSKVFQGIRNLSLTENICDEE